MQNRSFAQYLHFRDFEILESRKHSECCGSEVTQALILNKIPGFAKPSKLELKEIKDSHSYLDKHLN